MASQGILRKVEETSSYDGPNNEPHTIIPNFVAPDRAAKVCEFRPTSMQTGQKRTMHFGERFDDGAIQQGISLHRSQQVCILAGLGCIITKDVLDALPKHTYQVYPHPSFTLSVALADGRFQRVNTCKDVVGVVVVIFFCVLHGPGAQSTSADGTADGQLEQRVQKVETHRNAVIVPTGSRLCPDMNAKVWMGADDIARDGSKRPLFRDSFDADGHSLVVINHEGVRTVL